MNQEPDQLASRSRSFLALMRRRRRLLPFLFGCFGLGLAFASADPLEQPPQLSYLQEKIRREVLRTLQAGKISYLARPYDAAAFTIQTYPTYYYHEPAGAAPGQFELRPDTLAGYAALYAQGKLTLVARTGAAGPGVASMYSFYPFNPPADEKNHGIGSVDSTSYDIKLMQATRPYHSQAFIFMIPPRLSPTIMGFYDQGRLRFVDDDERFYGSVEELIIAKFGSRAAYLELLGKVRKRAAEDQQWYQSQHPSTQPSPLRRK